MAESKLGDRNLYLCTPDRPDLERFLEACITGGVDIVQLRDKDLDARPRLAAAARAMKVCRDHDVPFILNDRPDLALECDADGVHVGQADAPPALARRILGIGKIIGLSTANPAHLEDSLTQPVDYISAGPVERTATHPTREPVGVDYAARATRSSGRPTFVTGNVRPESIPALKAAGVTRFVVVRYLTEADDPVANARRLREAIQSD